MAKKRTLVKPGVRAPQEAVTREWVPTSTSQTVQADDLRSLQVRQRFPLNLDTQRGRDLMEQLKYDTFGNYTHYLTEYCLLDSFLQTLTPSAMSFGKSPLFVIKHSGDVTKSYVVVFKNRCFYYTASKPYNDDFEDELENSQEYAPAGVLLTNVEKRLQGNQGCRALILLNADEDAGGPRSSMIGSLEMPMPTVSFECLSRLYPGKIFKGFVDDDLLLLDYTVDEERPLREAERNLLKKRNGRSQLQPPELGFSFLEGTGSKPARWHRSGATLFRAVKRDQYYILGQDEGTYFGCELPGPSKTIEEAFRSLTPPEVTGAYQRQGEWFVVQVDEKEVPDPKDCVLLFDSVRQYEEIWLPVETPDSNKHWLYGEGRVSKDGKLFISDPVLQHEEHAELSVTGWCTFYKNTAIRSVSQEGVD